MGVKLARPGEAVWAISGDGGFQMNMQEIATMVQERIAVKMAVFNNGYLGMVRQWQQFFHGGRYSATPIWSPDYVKLADAYGIPGWRVERARGPQPVLAQARLTVIVNTDDATAEMTMRKLHKLSGVQSATRFPVRDGVARELALVKVRVPPERHAELLDVCDTFKATVVAEPPEQAIVQLAGTGAFVLAFVRALERFGILEMTRSGAVALPCLPAE